MSPRHRFHATTAGLRRRLACVVWPLNCGLALVAFAVLVTGPGPEQPTAMPWDLDAGALFLLDDPGRGGSAANLFRPGQAWWP